VGYNKITGILGNRKFFQTLWVLALPIVIQNLLISSLNMIDTLMIAAVGQNEVAAVGIANQYFFLFNLMITGIAGGCSVFIAQFWGGRSLENIHRIMGLGLCALGTVAALFTLAASSAPQWLISFFSDSPAVRQLGTDYLVIVCLSYVPTGITFMFSNGSRAMGEAKLPMLVSACAILTNTGLNYLLIFGKLGLPAMGVRGAAMATVIARVLECGLIVFFCLRPGMPLRGTLRSYARFSAEFIRNTFRTILPIVLNELCWGLGSVMYLVAYGKIGTHALAAANITSTVQNFFMVLCFSVASASLVMIGNKIGAGRQEEAQSDARRIVRLAGLLGLVLGIAIVFSAPFILSFFKKLSPEAVRASIRILRIFGATYFIRQINLVLIIGVFRGGGDAKASLIIELATMWIIGVPLAFLGAVVLHWPVEWVVALITLEDIIKFIACIIRLRQNRWIHDIMETLPAA